MDGKRGHWLSKKARVGGLGRRLRQGRKELGLSLEAVGERLSVAPNTIWRWEAGVHEPTREALEAAAALYGKPVSWFLEEKPQPQAERAAEDSDLRDLLVAWGSLTTEEQDFVRAVVRTALEHVRRRQRRDSGRP